MLDAVREQFWTAGYAATSLDDLMPVSGLGKGSLYTAFGDKHQLFLRALRSYTDTVHDQLRRALADCIVRAQREGDQPADTDSIALARALLAAQQGIPFMGRTGMDTATLTATARSLAARLLPERSDARAERY